MTYGATPEDIAAILALAGGCDASQTCPPKSCLCRAQAAALHKGWLVLKRKIKIDNQTKYYGSDEIDLIKKMYHEGARIRAIGDRLGRSKESVRWKISSMIKGGDMKSRRKRYLSGTDMTKRQKDVLDFIQAFWKEHGYAPSYEAIKSGVGLSSKSHIARIVVALTERGFITRCPRKARSIRVVQQEV